jgi:hypothetical protein
MSVPFTKSELELIAKNAEAGNMLGPGETQALVAEVRRLELASLGLFDPVRVGQVVAQLQMERDEARKVAQHHFILGRGGEEQRAAVLRDHPWLLEARTGRGEDDER